MKNHTKSISDFMVLWAGQLLSRTGSGISAFAIGVYLFRETGSTAAFSLFLLASFLPSVLLAPLGGVLADRTDRKWMMVAGDTGCALGLLFMMLMLRASPSSFLPLYLGAGICSCFAAFHSPAFKASLTDLLDESEYAQASGLVQLAEASRFLLAPIIAGYLLTRISLPLILSIDILSFAASIVSVLRIRRNPVRPPRPFNASPIAADLKVGIGHLLENKPLFRLARRITAVTFFTGMLQSLFAPMVLSLSDAETLGIIQSLAGIGMLASSLLVGLLSKTESQAKLLRPSLGAMGMCFLLIGLERNLICLGAFTFCLFAVLPLINTSLDVLFRQQMDNRLQGRLWSLISLISQLGLLLAFGISGFLADTVFNPLLTVGGAWANSLGRLMGTGPARGAGFLVMLSGLSLLPMTLFPVMQKERADPFLEKI